MATSRIHARKPSSAEVFLAGVTGGQSSSHDVTHIMCDHGEDGVHDEGMHHNFATTLSRGAFGAKTTAFDVRLGKRHFRFDMGSGAKDASLHSLTHKNSHPIVLAFSHRHLDHVSGAPFDPILWKPDDIETILAPEINGLNMHSAMKGIVFEPGMWPVTPTLVGSQKPDHVAKWRTLIPFETLKFEAEFEGAKGQVIMESFPQHHGHRGGSFGYKLTEDRAGGKSIVIATDTELAESEDQVTLAKYCEGADIVLVDVQYQDAEYLGNAMLGGLKASRVGWGHSCPSQLRGMLERCVRKPKRVVVIHHDPNRSEKHLGVFEERMRNLIQALGVKLDFGCEDFYQF